VATGATAAELANPLLLAAHAKQIVKALGGNESLVATRDHALFHVDASLGSGAEQTTARANLDRVGHRHA
jgi:hypothetical protein